MIIIYGLGNVGEQYALNKHNIGWIVLDKIANKLDLNWQKVSGGFYFKISNNIVCFKSDGFMNNSGEKLSKFILYQKIVTSNIQVLVIQDDSDQIVGCAKLLLAGGTAGHKGIVDMYKYSLSLGIELNCIWRLKIGIRPEGNKLKSETFVLTNVSEEEKNIATAISNLISLDLQKNNLSNFINLQQLINSEYVLKQAK